MILLIEGLKTYHLKYALPAENRTDVEQYATMYNDQIAICGDHLSYGSMNAAIRSGREAADLLHKSLRRAKKARPAHRE